MKAKQRRGGPREPRALGPVREGYAPRDLGDYVRNKPPKHERVAPPGLAPPPPKRGFGVEKPAQKLAPTLAPKPAAVTSSATKRRLDHSAAPPLGYTKPQTGGVTHRSALRAAIVQARTARGLSQVALSRLAGCAVTQLRDIEQPPNDGAQINLARNPAVARLAHALGIRLEDYELPHGSKEGPPAWLEALQAAVKSRSAGMPRELIAKGTGLAKSTATGAILKGRTIVGAGGSLTALGLVAKYLEVDPSEFGGPDMGWGRKPPEKRRPWPATSTQTSSKPGATSPVKCGRRGPRSGQSNANTSALLEQSGSGNRREPAGAREISMHPVAEAIKCQTSQIGAGIVLNEIVTTEQAMEYVRAVNSKLDIYPDYDKFPRMLAHHIEKATSYYNSISRLFATHGRPPTLWEIGEAVDSDFYTIRQSAREARLDGYECYLRVWMDMFFDKPQPEEVQPRPLRPQK